MKSIRCIAIIPTVYINKFETITKPPFRLVRFNAVTTLLGALTLLALNACQSTSGISTPYTVGQGQTQHQTKPAKTLLINALEKQRRSSYAYRTRFMASNQQRLASLNSASPQQLAMSDDPTEHCEHIHDESYVDLIQKAQSQKADISHPEFEVERNALKSAYLACIQQKEAWENWEHSADTDEFDNTEEDPSDLIDESIAINEEDEEDLFKNSQFKSPFTSNEVELSGAKSFSSNNDNDVLLINENTTTIGDADIDTQIDHQNAADQYMDNNSNNDSNDELAEFLPNYDSSRTKLDARKAKLLNAYLLKPFELSYSGVYKPYSGKLSIMPTLKYKIRNLNAETNNFIYVDAKEGAVYIWADTFAFILSEYLDEELGTSMHNKWIKIDLNDGSLPEGFIGDVLKAHFTAIDKMHTSSSKEDYRFLTTRQLKAIKPTSELDLMPYIQDSDAIIEHTVSGDNFDKGMQIYTDEFLSIMSEKYPNLDESDLKASADTRNNDWFSSRNIAILLMTILEHSGSSKTNNQIIEASSTLGDMQNVALVNPNINYAVKGDVQPENKWVWRELYGLDNHNRIKWQLSQHINSFAKEEAISDSDVLKGLNIESLTTYMPAYSHTPLFAFLPEGATEPNLHNSIVFKTYTENLVDRYKEGGGAAIGRNIYNYFLLKLIKKIDNK